MTRRDNIPGWTIRPIEQVPEYHACEEIQRRAWGFTGDLDIIPLTQLLAGHKAGGVVLGAFDSADQMLGFCYGFLGRRPTGELLHYSHMLAVDVDFRAAGVGAALKWAQRDAVLAQGIEWMVWTYDPLESLNGYLNFSKLGVIARTYWEDLYGQTSSGLHRGTATDRLLVEWALASQRTTARAAGAPAAAPGWRGPTTPLLAARTGDAGFPEPGAMCAGPDAAEVTIEIPSHIQDIKAADIDLARRWRSATRAAFLAALAAGYHVAECLRDDDRTYYLLRSEDPAFDA
jgi:predicted GNAT superfamily acetyltransferase